jgi:hypothetical protein
MMKLIEKLFGKKNPCVELEKENAELKAKLIEKQEHINKTNAYYKRLLSEKKKTKKA